VPENIFERNVIKGDFSKAASVYDAHSALQKIVREDALILAREYFADGAKILDLGCGTATLASENWDVIGADIAIGMCEVARKKNAKIINAAADALPFKNKSFDGVFSSLMLQWVEKPEAVFAEVLRVLKPEGVAVISTFIYGTLRELADAFKTIDDAPHVSDFLPAEQLIMRAAHAGAVVLEVHEETHEQEVKNVRELMKSIKKIGAGNKNVQRKKGLMTRAQLARVEAAYEGNIATWQVLTLVLGKR